MTVVTNGEGKDKDKELENLAETRSWPRRTRQPRPNSKEFLARARELRTAYDALEEPYWEARSAFRRYLFRYAFMVDGKPMSGNELLEMADAEDVS